MFKNISWGKIFTRTRDFIYWAGKKYTIFVLHLSPYQNILQGMVVYTLLGWIVLSLPFMDNGEVSFLDNLFTAASAASTTGLTSVNFADSYTFLGQLVVLILIQAGGIGYMTLSSFIYLSFSRRLRHRHKEVLNTEFALPRTVRLHDFLHAVVIFTTLVEIIGAVLLYNYFSRHGYSTFDAVWYGIFHSVSAFCTAGFSLFHDSFAPFADSKTINIVISILSLAGAMGFIIVTDLFNFITRRVKEISYTTKIIVVTTSVSVLFAGFVILITNPGMTPMAAFFQAIAAMTTAGFNTVPISSMAVCSVLIIMALMSVGGSPSGTGGGIKTTVATCLVAIVSSQLLGRRRVTFLGRQIPLFRLYIATSTFIFFVVLLFTVTFLLTWTESLPFFDLFYEATAALSTGGISTETTERLSALGKLIIIVTMLVGRVGVITFGMALIRPDDDEIEEAEEKPIEREDLAV